MTDYDTLEDFESAESDYEFDEELESLLLEDDEARRRRARRRPVRTGRGAGYYQSRPSGKYVTEAQLKVALAKVSKDVQANAAGIKSVGARVDSVAADTRKLGELVKKEGVERRKDLAKLKNSMQMTSLLPLLTSKSVTVARDTQIGGTDVKAGTKLSVAPDGIGLLLPLLLLGDGFGGGGSGGGDSSNTLLLVLALSGGL